MLKLVPMFCGDPYQRRIGILALDGIPQIVKLILHENLDEGQKEFMDDVQDVVDNPEGEGFNESSIFFISPVDYTDLQEKVGHLEEALETPSLKEQALKERVLNLEYKLGQLERDLEAERATRKYYQDVAEQQEKEMKAIPALKARIKDLLKKIRKEQDLAAKHYEREYNLKMKAYQDAADATDETEDLKLELEKVKSELANREKRIFVLEKEIREDVGYHKHQHENSLKEQFRLQDENIKLLKAIESLETERDEVISKNVALSKKNAQLKKDVSKKAQMVSFNPNSPIGERLALVAEQLKSNTLIW